MTTKPKSVKAWGWRVLKKYGSEILQGAVTTRKFARDNCPRGNRVIRVEIREIKRK